MTIDVGMQELQSEWRVTDIKGNVHKMRQERGGSVQTAVQYKFIHQALEECVYPTIAPIYPTVAPIDQTAAPIYQTVAPIYPTAAPIYQTVVMALFYRPSSTGFRLLPWTWTRKATRFHDTPFCFSLVRCPEISAARNFIKAKIELTFVCEVSCLFGCGGTNC
jgi:hypothetical protein